MDLTKKAVATTATATDQGSFSAIAAAWTVDRDNEQIARGAFSKTIKAWQGRDKPIPLHWNHSAAPEDIIGEVDPHSLKETDFGLHVRGQLDVEGSEVAKEAWRLVKRNSIGLSFGFLGTGHERPDGSREITEIDLFEVSLTPAPANPDTQLLDWKSTATPPKRVPTEQELVAQMKRLGLQLPLTESELRRKCEDLTLKVALNFEDPPRPPEPYDGPSELELRRKSDEVQLSQALGWEEPPDTKPEKRSDRWDYDEVSRHHYDLMYSQLKAVQ